MPTENAVAPPAAVPMASAFAKSPECVNSAKKPPTMESPAPVEFISVPFAAGLKFAVTYHYYPLDRFQHEQPGKALLKALNAIKLQAEAEKNDVLEQLQASRAEITRLNNQLAELQSSRAAYETSLENLYESSSWKLTAPLRALRRLFHG